MLKRVITSVVALCVFIPILIFSDSWVFPIAMAFASLAGCYEMLGCTGQRKNVWVAVPIYALSVFFPMFMRYSYNYISQDSIEILLELALSIIFISMLYIFGVSVFDNKRFPVKEAGLVFLSCLYIISSFTCIVYLRDYVHLGKYIYLLVFMCAWMTDTFAYFTGRLFGKHKLIPEISPKKTVEGAIGGVFFCVVTTVVFGLIIESAFDPDATIKANHLILIISGIFISVVSQIGDLILSAIKRSYNIKDYGKLLPGHGGILDRFDSVMAVAVLLSFICTYFNMFANQ